MTSSRLPRYQKKKPQRTNIQAAFTDSYFREEKFIARFSCTVFLKLDDRCTRVNFVLYLFKQLNANSSKLSTAHWLWSSLWAKYLSAHNLQQLPGSIFKAMWGCPLTLGWSWPWCQWQLLALQRKPPANPEYTHQKLQHFLSVRIYFMISWSKAETSGT